MLFHEVGTLTVPQQWRRYEILYIHFQLEFFFFLADVAFEQAGMRFLEFFHDVSLSVTSV